MLHEINMDTQIGSLQWNNANKYNACSSHAIIPAMFHFAPKNALHGVNNEPNQR